jgi:DNA replication protein DnaC
MITKENTYKKAFEIKKQGLFLKQKKRELTLNAAYVTNPRLYEIDNKLSSLGAALAMTALSGDTAKLEQIKAQSQVLSCEKDEILKKCEVFELVYDCPICKDTGYINGKICECVKKIANSIAINELSAKMPISECRFDNFDLSFYSEENENPRRRMTGILKLCKEYALNFDPKTSENLLELPACLAYNIF